jgi:hypothetical protein
MKKLRLFVLITMTGMLVGAVAGCHRPVKATIWVPDPPGQTQPGAYAEERGTLEFWAQTTTDPVFDVYITSVTNGSVSPCTEDVQPLVSKVKKVGKGHFQVAICHVKKGGTGDYTVQITPHGQDKDGTTPVKTFYVRACPPGCTHTIR